MPRSSRRAPIRLAVIWIDWYTYHIARYRGLAGTPELHGRVAGIELIGGVGVHAGLRFRADLPSDLQVTTLLPDASWGGVSQLHVARLLWKHLTELDPAAVLVPGYYTLPALAAAIWAQVHDRQSILMTESTAYDHDRSAWKELFKGWLLRSIFDSAVVGGSAHRRYLHALGFPLDRVEGYYDVVDNAGIAAAVATLRESRTPEEFQLPCDPYFLYVGRLAPEKNVSTLLQAWAAYRAQGGTWALVLGGDGSDAAGLREQAASLPDRDAVFFTGHRTSQELLPLYAFASCFVLPSTREPWGLVVNEAMTAGLPVLISDRCGSAEDLVVPGRNGFTFSPLDHLELKSLLSRVSGLSVEDRESLGQQSASHIASYTPQQFGRAIAHLLSKQ